MTLKQVTKPKKWITRDIEPFGSPVKCNFHTRLVVSGERTPSGTRYEFQPGEVRDDVLKKDVEYLLSLIYQQSACCGNQPGEPIHYFELVQ